MIVNSTSRQTISSMPHSNKIKEPNGNTFEEMIPKGIAEVSCNNNYIKPVDVEAIQKTMDKIAYDKWKLEQEGKVVLPEEVPRAMLSEEEISNLKQILSMTNKSEPQKALMVIWFLMDKGVITSKDFPKQDGDISCEEFGFQGVLTEKEAEESRKLDIARMQGTAYLSKFIDLILEEMSQRIQDSKEEVNL